MSDSIEFPLLPLPQIRPSSTNTANNTDRTMNMTTDTNAYEQWRANIHQQLEDDLQRQVQQVLDENERQERLARLRRQFLKSNSRLPTQTNENNTRSNDPYSEIDRRNQRILYPLNAKDSYGTQKYHSSFNYQRTKLSSHSFNLETYNSYCRRSLQRNDEHSFDDPNHYFPTLPEQRTTTNNHHHQTSSFQCVNQVIRSNKADILTHLNPQSDSGDLTATYTTKYGVIISGDGPFWPRDHRILYPTPQLLSRELIPKEFYLPVTQTFLSSK